MVQFRILFAKPSITGNNLIGFYIISLCYYYIYKLFLKYLLRKITVTHSGL